MPCTKLSHIKVVLLDVNKSMCDSWAKNLDDFIKTKSNGSTLNWFNAPVEIQVHHGSFDSLAKESPCNPLPYCENYHKKVAKTRTVTTVLSPGNSIGYMGGGFDRALAQLFSHGDFDWRHSEHHVQTQLLDLYKGYLTPSNSNLIEFHTESFYRDSKAWNELGANSILHIPTMRVPRVLDELSTIELYRTVFDWTWEVLSTVNKANIEVFKWKEDKHAPIDTMILTGLGTGYGGIPVEVVGKAMIAALVIYTDHTLERVQKSIYCLKFLGEDYGKLMALDKLDVHVNTDPFDPLVDTIDKLF